MTISRHIAYRTDPTQDEKFRINDPALCVNDKTNQARAYPSPQLRLTKCCEKHGGAMKQAHGYTGSKQRASLL
jgi:hypothetical protein